mmetsp:Transcript_85872/g.243529  ORF Transcript_85872/g.243529 Transcript_85872/m.243529 type:complete len:188 (-) Transcript_85872:170-733(-)
MRKASLPTLIALTLLTGTHAQDANALLQATARLVAERVQGAMQASMATVNGSNPTDGSRPEAKDAGSKDPVKHWAADSCKNAVDQKMWTPPDMELPDTDNVYNNTGISVRCCPKTPIPNSKVTAKPPDCQTFECKSTATWAEAFAHCNRVVEDKGWRLCTLEEARDNHCCQAGCMSSRRLIWTSTPR